MRAVGNSRAIEDIYELTYIRKDGSRFPAVVSVTALRDARGTIIGYRLIGTELKAGALQSAIFNSANFSSIATDAKGVIQIFKCRRRADARLTQQSKKMLAHLSGDPGNPAGYLRRIDAVASINPIARSYLDEALRCYVAHSITRAGIW
jgi:hypothetical protein